MGLAPIHLIHHNTWPVTQIGPEHLLSKVTHNPDKEGNQNKTPRCV